MVCQPHNLTLRTLGMLLCCGLGVLVHGSALATDSNAQALLAEKEQMDPALFTAAADPAYGEYLAGECLSCHRAAGAAPGIPQIAGKPSMDLMVALHAYRLKLRPNATMQQVAGRLSPEEIASLAVYFAETGQ